VPFVGGTSDTEWVNGIILQTGISTVFPPITRVTLATGGQNYDVNFTSTILGPTTLNLTYVAITSGSYDSDGVNDLKIDGSCRFTKTLLVQHTWRALGTRACGEVISSDSY
jgi:hypothetical protein